MQPMIAFILFGLCQAHFQPNPFGSSASNTTTHDVNVGKSGSTFEPVVITAGVGDKINFHFWPTNHSVAESSFDKPCQPKSDGHAIFSGFFPTKNKASDKMFSITVNTSDPIWLYCSQPENNPCKNGQVMVINPPNNTARSMHAYAAASRASTNTTSPKEIYGGIELNDNKASPNVTATGVDVATQTKKSEAIDAVLWIPASSIWYILGFVAAFIAAL